MNILLVTDDFYPNLGGVAQTLMNLYKFIKEKGHIIYVINPYFKAKDIFNDISFLENYTFKSLIYSILKKKFFHFTIYAFWKLIRDKNMSYSQRLRLILHFMIKPRLLVWVIENLIRLYPRLKTLNFDIIIGGNSYNILDLNFLISRIFNKKIISMAHGDDFIPKSLIFKNLYYKSIYFKNVDKIILSNNLMKKLIKKIHFLDEDKLEVINREININELELKESKKELRNEFGIPENQFIVLSVGVHRYIKRFDLVIQAIHKIKEINPKLDIKYCLVGNGEQTPYLKKLTENLKLNNEVEFLGICDNKKRNKYYKLSDIFIMPSISTNNCLEGFGISFIEANYYKIPVIGSRSGGIPAAIKDGENGLLIEQNNINDLVEKILFLYNHEELRKQMGEKGNRRVLNEYTVNTTINDYIRVFKSLL